MANARWSRWIAFAGFAAALLGQSALSQTPPAPPLRLYAVEITTGAKWDASKPPNQQAFMKEHSAHLKKLRDDGIISMGARYGDKGLVVISAADENQARALMAADPSMQNETFRFTLHEMRVFYPGQVGEAAPRKTP